MIYSQSQNHGVIIEEVIKLIKTIIILNLLTNGNKLIHRRILMGLKIKSRMGVGVMEVNVII